MPDTVDVAAKVSSTKPVSGPQASFVSISANSVEAWEEGRAEAQDSPQRQ